MEHKLLGEILKEEGLVSDEQIQQALEEQRRTGKLLGKILVDCQFITEKQLLRALGVQKTKRGIDWDNLDIPKDVLAKVPFATARLNNVLPIELRDDTLTVCVSDSLNIALLDDLQFITGLNIKMIEAASEDIHKAIERLYGSSTKTLTETITEAAQSKIEFSTKTDLKDLANQTPVVKLLDMILLKATEDRASDIHFEPFRDKFYIRERVDGVLYDIVSPPKSLNLALVSRIKVLANLDVAESRLPQDGRIMLSIAGRNVDLRVSTLPTIFGESVVMRVLDRSTVGLNLEQLGMSIEMQKKMEELINRPNGIILVTGPTGSGKTTTLYAVLNKINKTEIKIITTEDPVEYDIPGIIQVPINHKIEFDYVLSLRHILRQDPDVIMVGEIRDPETATISIQSALTGHLVFSTLHTNDAASAITRLLNMGIESFLISSTLEAVLAQRLVRRICPDCKEGYIPKEKEIESLNIDPSEVKDRPFYRGRGCDRCNQSGYRGRTGIFELFILDDKIRQMIIQGCHTDDLRKTYYREQGLPTLYDDGVAHIFNQETTLSEVIREVHIDT